MSKIKYISVLILLCLIIIMNVGCKKQKDENTEISGEKEQISIDTSKDTLVDEMFEEVLEQELTESEDSNNNASPDSSVNKETSADLSILEDKKSEDQEDEDKEENGTNMEEEDFQISDDTETKYGPLN